MLRQINALDAGGAGTLGTPYVGIPGGAIPVGSYIYDSLDLPADAGKYYRGEVLTWPAQGTLTAYEDGSYDYDPGSATGVQTFTAQLYENDNSLGPPITVALTIGSTTPTYTQYPAPSDVKTGVRYGVSGEYTGTLTSTGGNALGISIGQGVGLTLDGQLIIG